MDEFEKDDNIGRDIFAKLFKHGFKSLWFAPPRCWFDASGVTLNNKKLLYEIKYREKYTVEKWSGSTWLEKYKRDCFNVFNKENPGFELYYICFWQDGWTLFDVNRRIEAKTSEWVATFPNYAPRTTSINTGYTEKRIVLLRYNPGEYKDKLRHYENN